MRDPSRIPKLMEALEEIWETCPDMRLGQLMVNIQTRGEHPLNEHDLFNIEDDKMLERLREYRNQINLSKKDGGI